jgi:hypothetical protein
MAGKLRDLMPSAAIPLSMNEPATAQVSSDWDPDAADAVRARLSGTNINERSLLATDYLNHFNEIVMVLDLIPDLPDCIEEARAWAPKGYKDHFRDSTFSDRDLAIEAYDHAPPEYRELFEDTVERMNQLIERALDRIDDALATGDRDFVALSTSSASRKLQTLMDIVSAVINGEKTTMGQDEIDEIMQH